MLILGIDPGYTNLGLALVDSDSRKILSTTTLNCGSDPASQHRFLFRKVKEFTEKHGCPDLIVSEQPPFGFSGGSRGGRTACIMWWVLGIIRGIFAEADPPLRTILPKTLKHYAAGVIDVSYKQWPTKGSKRTRAEEKWGVSEAVKKLSAKSSHKPKTDHESDAVLAAFSAIP